MEGSLLADSLSSVRRKVQGTNPGGTQSGTQNLSPGWVALNYPALPLSQGRVDTVHLGWGGGGRGLTLGRTLSTPCCDQRGRPKNSLAFVLW